MGEIEHKETHREVKPGKISKKRMFTREEVKKHDKKGDCWIIVDQKVYNVSNFGKHHPGGEVIYFHGGKDVTCVFRAYHPDYVYDSAMFKHRCIGEIVPEDRKTLPLDKVYLDLYKDMEKRKYFETSYKWYAIKLAYPLLSLLIGLYLVIQYGSQVSYLVLGSLLIGFAQNQIAFICHDLGHSSVTKSLSWDYWICVPLANCIFGVSQIWWRYTHSAHHVLTNEWDRDPDITHCPIFSVDKGQYLHKNGQKLNFFQKTLLYLSPILFVPIVLLLGRFSMYWQGIYMLFILKKVPTMIYQQLHHSSLRINAERIATIFYFSWWGALLYSLPTWKHRFILIFVPNLIVGFLHIQLVLSHYERPSIYSGDKAEDLTWLEQQVITGRNINGDIRNEWLYGGLHYQIEHHLFPRMSRHNHRKVQQHVIPICKKYGIPYARGGFFEVLVSVLKTITLQSRYAFYKPLTEGRFDFGDFEMFTPH